MSYNNGMGITDYTLVHPSLMTARGGITVTRMGPAPRVEASTPPPGNAGPAPQRECRYEAAFQDARTYTDEITRNIYPQEQDIITRCTYARKLEQLQSQMESAARRAASECGRRDLLQATPSRQEAKARVASDCNAAAAVQNSQAQDEASKRRRSSAHRQDSDTAPLGGQTSNLSPAECSRLVEEMNRLDDARGENAGIISAMRVRLAGKGCAVQFPQNGSRSGPSVRSCLRAKIQMDSEGMNKTLRNAELRRAGCTIKL